MVFSARTKSFFVVFITSLLFFYEFGLNNIFNAIQSHVRESLHLTEVIAGIISSLFFYVEIILLVPAGLLVDKYSPKVIILIVLILSALGVLLTGYATNIAMLVIGRILMGIGGAFGFIACIRIAVNWLEPKDMGKGTSLIATIGIFGGLVVQAPLTLLINKTGWQAALNISAFVGFFIALLIFYFVRNNPRGQTHVLHTHENHIQLGLFERLYKAFFNKQNLFCAIYTSLMNLPLFMLGAMWGIAYLTKVNQVTELEASSICSMLFLGTMIGSPIVGIISDTFKQRKFIMQIGAAISLVLILVIVFYNTKSTVILLFLYFFLGFITSTQMLSYPTVIESNSKLISSSATSVISMLAMVGGAVIQPLFGYIAHDDNKIVLSTAEILKSYYHAILLLPIAFFLAFIVSCFIKEMYVKETK